MASIWDKLGELLLDRQVSVFTNQNGLVVTCPAGTPLEEQAQALATEWASAGQAPPLLVNPPQAIPVVSYPRSGGYQKSGVGMALIVVKDRQIELEKVLSRPQVVIGKHSKDGEEKFEWIIPDIELISIVNKEEVDSVDLQKVLDLLKKSSFENDDQTLNVRTGREADKAEGSS